MRAVSIDRYYHPNAKMSFRNISPRREEKYKDMLRKLVVSIKR
jgi:CO dehydrogenase/acetyl-CoA synthase epsilon subunit